jgi:creatinine amidohydrolase
LKNPLSIKLEELSWPEIKSRVEGGWTKIIVPLGATEQHGPGLPQGVDTWHGEATALRAASILGKTMVAPAVPFGYSPEHTAFAGTISLRNETLRFLLEDIAESLARSGFTFIYFWFGHGGDWAVARECLPALRYRWPGCFITYTEDVGKYVAETWDTLPLEEGVALEVSGSHAGEFEASMITALRPDLINTGGLALGDSRPLSEILEPMMQNGIHTISANGVLGDQRQANAARGERYLNGLAHWLVADIRRQGLVNE